MLIRELLDLVDSSTTLQEEMIFEDLGNFKNIRKDLMTVFSKGFLHKDFAGLRDKLGKDSDMKTYVAKNTSSAFDQLEDVNNVGFVLRYGSHNNEQILAVSIDKKSRDMKNISLIADVNFIKNNDPEEYKKIIDKFFVSSGFIKDTMSKANAMKLTTSFIKTIRKMSETPEIIIIGVDTKRAEKKSSRYKEKTGMILTPAEVKMIGKNNWKAEKEWKDSFKYQLGKRLDKFKALKSEKVENPEQMLVKIKEKGWLDKITIDGYVYNLYRDNISFRGLKNPKDSFYSGSYIEYRIDDDGYDEKTKHGKLRHDLYDLRQKLKDDDSLTDEQKEKKLVDFMVKMPPLSIKVKLGLKGSSIEPTGEMEFERR